MSRPSFISKIIGTAAALVLMSAPILLSQDKIGTWDGAFPTGSARAISMGLCTINLIDEESSLHNPGALGLFHLIKLAAFSFPNSTKLLPGRDGNFRIRTFAGSARVPLISRTRDDLNKIGFSLALAYSERTVQDELYAISYEYLPIPVKFAHHMTFYTAAAAIDISQFRVGAGYSYKVLNSENIFNGVLLEDTVEYYVHDIGFMVQWLPQGSGENSRDLSDGYKLRFTPSLAYVISNIGHDYNRYSDKIKSLGLSLPLYISRNNFTVLTLNPVLQIDYVNNLSLKGSSDNSDENLRHWGIELGLFDILYGRIGNRDVDDNAQRTKTWGFGVSLKGVIERFYSGPENSRKRGAGFLRNLDFRYDYGRVTPWYDITLNYMKMSVSI
ncbi:hypothetical protein TRIP_C20281 [Candidatus Zixiibacteriota bacterium]|nr:hypothetical protein TRIP_C20281 [candidate division Zixibacteria bacterium]